MVNQRRIKITTTDPIEEAYTRFVGSHPRAIDGYTVTSLAAYRDGFRAGYADCDLGVELTQPPDKGHVYVNGYCDGWIQRDGEG